MYISSILKYWINDSLQGGMVLASVTTLAKFSLKNVQLSRPVKKAWILRNQGGLELDIWTLEATRLKRVGILRNQGGTELETFKPSMPPG